MARGVRFGRPPGTSKSKLDEHREEIVALLKTGSTQAYLTRKYNTTAANFSLWLKKHDLRGMQPEY
jgi:hypothetical protein